MIKDKYNSLYRTGNCGHVLFDAIIVTFLTSFGDLFSLTEISGMTRRTSFMTGLIAARFISK